MGDCARPSRACSLSPSAPARVDHVRLSGVGAIAPDPGFGPVQQIGQDLRVVDVRGGGDGRVDQLGLTVDADVGFHSKIPLVSLLRLAHLGVALLLPVLGRPWGRDDRGINDGAPPDAHPTGCQMGVDQRKDLFAETVLLEQVAELARRRLIGGGLAPKVDPHEGAHRTRVIECFLDGGPSIPNHCCRK